jgi:hypothetical protein
MLCLALELGRSVLSMLHYDGALQPLLGVQRLLEGGDHSWDPWNCFQYLKNMVPLSLLGKQDG